MDVHDAQNGIRAELFRLRDAEYAAFQAKLLPDMDAGRIIGVRTPALRDMAKRVAEGGGAEPFLAALPHQYFDENQLHAFIVSREKDFARCMALTESFLPHIDNWATCDQFSPAVFRRHPGEVLAAARRWLSAEHAYTVRFAVGMLMRYFLDERFSPEYPALVAGVRSEEYYVRMEIAWYFATALAKQYDAVLPYMERRQLDAWTHNKAIQKSIESRRVPPERKAYLRTLTVPAAARSRAAQAQEGRR